MKDNIMSFHGTLYNGIQIGEEPNVLIKGEMGGLLLHRREASVWVFVVLCSYLSGFD